MAEEHPQNTAIVEETKVAPTDEVEERPEPTAGTPVPAVAKINTPELTESPDMVAQMAIELATAKTEADALVGAITEISTKSDQIGGFRWPRGNIQVDQSDAFGSEGTKIHFTGKLS